MELDNQPTRQLSKQERREFKHQQKITEQNRILTRKMVKRGIKILIIVLMVSAIGGGIWYSSVHSPKPKTNREVALACTTDMATQFHIHPNLTILINGVQQEIPANIGIKPYCMNALHTHDNSGTIHIESPEQRDFTLSDFLSVWGKVFNKDQILDYKVDDRHVIRETVNGQKTQDYENTILRDKDQIIIYYEGKK